MLMNINRFTITIKGVLQMPTIKSVKELEVSITENAFTQDDKRKFKNFEFYLNLPWSISKFIIIADSLKDYDKSIYTLAVELKKRKAFHHQSFPRIITKLRESNYIRIFINDTNERCLEITDPFINTILAM